MAAWHASKAAYPTVENRFYFDVEQKSENGVRKRPGERVFVKFVNFVKICWCLPRSKSIETRKKPKYDGCSCFVLQ